MRPKFIDHPFTLKFILEQIQPLRAIFYLHLLGFFVHELEMSLESSLYTFNSVPILVAANIGFILFTEKERLREKGVWLGSLWIITIMIGLLAVEFLGIAAHALLSFPNPDDPQVQYWKMISLLFTGIGGYLLTITNFIGEKLDKKIKLSKKQGKFISVLLLCLAIAINIYSLYLNPVGWNNILNYLSNLF